MAIEKILAFLSSSIIIYLIKEWEKADKIKKVFETLFLVNKKKSFEQFTMFFYIFGISYFVLYRIFLLDFGSLIEVLIPATGFIFIYRVAKKFNI